MNPYQQGALVLAKKSMRTIVGVRVLSKEHELLECFNKDIGNNLQHLPNHRMNTFFSLVSNKILFTYFQGFWGQ